MYKIERTVYTAKKPLWMQSLLFNIDPSWYDPLPTKEECRRTLSKILLEINGRSYHWHQQYARLSNIGQVITTEDSIRILTKKGKLFLSFVVKDESAEHLP